MEEIIPLFPENIEGNVKTFYTLQGAGKLQVKFIVNGKMSICFLKDTA